MKLSRIIPMAGLVFVIVGFAPATTWADCSEKLITRLLDSGFSKAEILELCGERIVPRTFDRRGRSGGATCNALNQLKDQIERAYEDCREYNRERWDDWENEHRKRHGTRDPWRMPPMDLSCGDYLANLDRIEEQTEKFCD